ncbi:MAG: PhnD/SsuA/transferrin family substrate-binding protein [Chloroflexota bacterium]
MIDKTLRVVTFLAPNTLPVYQFAIDYMGKQIGYQTSLVVGSSYEEVYDADLSFICGLPYVLRTRTQPRSIEAIVAPVLQGERYHNQAIYFSDVIVQRDSPFQIFADLRGCTWAYNEPESQSGYGVTRYSLVQRGETRGYFREVVQAGFHQRAIRMVCSGEIDATAIDSQVLAVELRDHPELADQLRVIDALGPSTIQPLTAARHLPASLKTDIQAVFATMHTDPAAHAYLDRGLIDHYVAVDDASYDDIRLMLTACEKAQFLTLI